LDDGTRLEADTVIFCTGFIPHDELLQNQKPVNKGLENSSISASSFPKLYQNVFPPEYVDCLAYSCYWVTPTSVLGMADLIAMAVAQVFKGGYQLPSIPEMNIQIDKHQAWVRS
jgi:dimethylaniline monooxygenase (N-oxide forming)